MKKTMSETSNGPAEKEEQRDTNDEEDMEEDMEDYDEEEFSKLNAELDALNTALDAIEEKNDFINVRLRQILMENKSLREAEGSGQK
ncbi:UPF0184 protein AAEL002161-like [Penaeus chinensis]|uniref:UPF0184 protein AAEL002161-like n=1 Tax=Penaeus chinensis TaxID=139456 RepID=UPI001FB61E1D|nr:UPF0184 protein AAEL002161-like [Penaeus chinensis]